MPEQEIDTFVFDLLGTPVDEPAGLRAGTREPAPALDESRCCDLH